MDGNADMLPEAASGAAGRQPLTPVYRGSVLVVSDGAVDHGAEYGADDRRDPEEPELSDGPAAGEHGHARAARRVDGRVGHRDADQMDERQAEPDRGRFTTQATAGADP